MQHRKQGPSAKHPKREINVHTCERKAYERLAQHGLCDKGLVPKFYGIIENMNIDLWQPLLVQFLNDWWCDYPPNAIIMEYIPGMQRLWLDNYSPKRAEGFLHQIKEIHKAGILHDDPHPRNMMVFGDDPDRVMWIDFDRAQVDDGVFYTSETLQEMLDEEDILVAEVGPMIVSLSNCYRCFRSWFSFLTGFLGK